MQHARRGKASQVDAFTGGNPENHLEDWLPTIDRAAIWNGWTEEEQLLQLADHMREQALQERNLLSEDNKAMYTTAFQALQNHLDPGCRALAAQDFCHTIQDETEPVADFMWHLERTFEVSYGREGMSGETQDTF